MFSIIIDILSVVFLVVYSVFGFTLLLDCKKILSKYKGKDLSFKEVIDFIKEWHND